MIKQISVFLENRSGTLEKVTSLLAENGINILALFLAESADYGVLRMIVEDTEKAKEVLVADDFPVDERDVTAVPVPDRPGGLADLLKKMAGWGIDVSYMYSVFGKRDAKAHMVLRVSDQEKLEKCLVESGEAFDDLSNLK